MEQKPNKITNLAPTHLEISAIVNEIEAKYGSVTKAPNNEPNLKLLHQIGLIYNKLTKSPKKDFETICQLENLLNLGFSMKEIAERLEVSYYFVSQTVKKKHLKPKVVFRYQLIQEQKGIYIYTTSLRSLIQFYHLDKFRSNEENLRLLQAQGCKISKDVYHWYELPSYCFYQAKEGQNNWYVKCNQDSYNKILAHQLE